MKKINEYTALIERINDIIIRLNIKEDILTNNIDELNQEINNLNESILLTEERLKEENNILYVLRNYEFIIKNIIKKESLPMGLATAGLIALVGLLITGFNLGVIPVALAIGLITGLLRHLDVSQKVRKIKKTYQKPIQELKIQRLSDSNRLKRRRLNWCIKEMRDATIKRDQVILERGTFRGYKEELEYGEVLANDLEAKNVVNAKRVFVFDQKAQEIQKRVREKVEN